MVCAGDWFLGNDVKEGYETADFPQDAVGTHHLSQEATGSSKASFSSSRKLEPHHPLAAFLAILLAHRLRRVLRRFPRR